MAVNKAPVRQQSYLTEYDRQMAEYLRQMSGSIGAQDIAAEAYGGKFPVGTMTAKILSGVLAGASDRRAANRIKQSNAAQVALLRGAQEYSEPLPTEFEGAGKFTDAQGTYTQELAPVYQGIPQDANKAAFDARMLKEQYPEGVLASGVQPPGKVDVAMVEGPKSEFETTGAAYSQPEITEEFATQQNITPYAEPERKQLYPQETVQGITVEGTSEKPNWFDRIFKGEVSPTTAKNQDELAILAGYDPLEYRIYQNEVNKVKTGEEKFETSFVANIYNQNGESGVGRISEKTIKLANGTVKKIATIYDANTNNYIPIGPGFNYSKITDKKNEIKPRYFAYTGDSNIEYTDTNGAKKILNPNQHFRIEGPNAPKELLALSRTQDAEEKKLVGAKGFSSRPLVSMNNPATVVASIMGNVGGTGDYQEELVMRENFEIPYIDQNNVQQVHKYQAGELITNKDERFTPLFNELQESTIGAITTMSKAGFISAQKLVERRDALLLQGQGINALINYVDTVDQTDQGIQRTIDTVNSWFITTFLPSQKLSSQEEALRVSNGQLSRLGGNLRVDILGPGVMTEYDFLRLQEALGGEPTSKQSIQAFKRTLNLILEEKMGKYNDSLSVYEGQRTKFGDLRAEVIPPINLEIKEYKSFFEPSDYPSWNTGMIKRMEKGDSMFNNLITVQKTLGVNAKDEDYLKFFNPRQWKEIKARLKLLGIKGI